MTSRRAAKPPAAWSIGSTQIETHEGHKVIESWSSNHAPGLAIHIGGPARLGAITTVVWTITHVASGRSVIKDLTNLDRAQAAAIALAKRLDWTTSLAELLTIEHLQAVVTAVAAEYGAAQ